MSSPLPESWARHLEGEFDTPGMQALKAFLRQQKDERRVVYPPSEHWFRAFELTPLDSVKVVVLGQDPYHGPGQAHGLCFSVRPDVAVPPSLLNVYKELESDEVEFTRPDHGFLESWARQGVLLLNSVLTVERASAASHRGQGWEAFTDRAIETVNRHCESVVFLLWGSHARKKAELVDQSRHLVLHAPHPSPLSAHRGFFGCRHFSHTNAFLQERGKAPVDWRLPPREALSDTT